MKRFPLFDQANDGGGGAAGAPPPAAAPAPAPAPAATPAPAPAPATAPAPAPASAPAPVGTAFDLVDPPAGPDGWLPAKYQVKKSDGTLDLEASARRVSEAHASLEKKLGSGDVPPKTPDEYTPADGKTFKFADIKADPQMQGFLKGAHALGMTNKQVEFVIQRYMDEMAPDLVAGAQALDTEAAVAKLREVWTDESSFKTNMQSSVRAVRAFAGDDAQRLMTKYGTDPDFIRLMARIGTEVKEDSPPGGGAQQGEVDNINTLLAHPAVLDIKHPEHAAINQRIKQHYERVAAKMQT